MWSNVNRTYQRKIAKLCRLIISSLSGSGGGFPSHLRRKSTYPSQIWGRKCRREVLKAVTLKMYGRLSYRQNRVFFTILLETPPSCFHNPIDLEKTHKSQKTPSYIRKWTKVRSRFLCLSGCFGAITTGSSGCRITISSLVDEHLLSTTEKKMGKVVEWWCQCRQRVPPRSWMARKPRGGKKQVKIRISAFQG